MSILTDEAMLDVALHCAKRLGYSYLSLQEGK